MRWRLAAPILAAFVASVAGAQTPPSKPSAEAPIVIQGRLKQAIGAFVQRFTQSGPTDQIAHWKDQICPEVLGIDPAQVAFMEDRIDALARTVRLRPGGSNCLAPLAAMLIIVDATQLKDVSVSALSDYVAMVALTNPNDRPDSYPNSVLALFDGRAVPGAELALTDFDRTFLATLNHEPVDRSAAQQREMLKAQMGRALRTASAPPKDR